MVGKCFLKQQLFENVSDKKYVKEWGQWKIMHLVSKTKKLRGFLKPKITFFDLHCLTKSLDRDRIILKSWISGTYWHLQWEYKFEIIFTLLL